MATVLLVDDDPTYLELAGGLLEKVSGVYAIFAHSAAEALQAMDRALPDLVISDISMPGMDGLELLEHVHRLNHAVPVILMTSHGSEELAVQALKHGAASYVPKTNLTRDLREIVSDVLAVAAAERQRRRLHECCMTATEAEFSLENDPALAVPLIGQLQEYLAAMNLRDEEGRIRAGIALQEALSNAMFHGNLEISSALKEQDQSAYYALAERRRRESPYTERRVHVTARVSRTEAVFQVRDDGPGFRVSEVPDPTDPENVGRMCGRGLLLIGAFMDHVEHNDRGNEITMTIRKQN